MLHRLVFFDGHSTHCQKSCRRNHNILLAAQHYSPDSAPSWTSLGVLVHLSTRNVRCSWGRILAKWSFHGNFCKSWYRSILYSSVVFPFNRNAVKVIDSAPQINDQKSLCEKNWACLYPLVSGSYQKTRTSYQKARTLYQKARS